MFAFEDERIDFSFPNSEPSLIKELKKATKKKGKSTMKHFAERKAFTIASNIFSSQPRKPINAVAKT